MTPRSRFVSNHSFRLGCAFALALLATPSTEDRADAQGLSGTPQRLEETLGRAEPPRSGAAPSTGRSQTPTAGDYSVGPRSGSPQSRGGSPDDYSGDYDMEDDYDMDMDMQMEMEMEMSYGGGRSSRSIGSRSDAAQTYGSNLISALADIDLTPIFSPDPGAVAPSGPVLHREAEQAFQAGYHAVALELMFGHMTAEYDEAGAVLRNVKYSKQLRRPVWAVRWGVSIDIRGDAVEDPSPIREGATPNRRQLAAGGGGFGGGDDYDAMMDQEMEADMAEEMESDMDMEMDMEMEMAMGGGGRGMAGRRRGSKRPAAPAIPEREMLSPAAQEKLDETMGLVAKVAAEEMGKRISNGDFGPLFTSVSAPPPKEPARRNVSGQPAAPTTPQMSAALNQLLLDAGEPIPMWKPGIVYLGEGSMEEIVPAARAANIDLVLHFQVALNQRNQQVQNITRCRLLNVWAEEKRYWVRISSKGMDSAEAATFASKGRMGEREYVETQMQALLELIDRDVKVLDLPPFPADVARKRIATLIDSPNARSLRTLAEIRLFQAQGLIDQAEVEAAFDIIGGDDALALLHGPQEERLAIARAWAAGLGSSDGR